MSRRLPSPAFRRNDDDSWTCRFCQSSCARAAPEIREGFGECPDCGLVGPLDLRPLWAENEGTGNGKKLGARCASVECVFCGVRAHTPAGLRWNHHEKAHPGLPFQQKLVRARD